MSTGSGDSSSNVDKGGIGTMNSSMLFDKLDGCSNYSTWKFQMELFLTDTDLWEYTNVTPEATDTEANIPQGKASDLRCGSSESLCEEDESNVGKILLQQVSNMLQGKLMEGKGEAQLKLKDDEDNEKKKKIGALIAYLLVLLQGKDKLAAAQANVEGSTKQSQSYWTSAWEYLKEVLGISNEKPSSQAIVQSAKKDNEYSLLQNIQSGRVRRPVHVYGHHSKEESGE